MDDDLPSNPKREPRFFDKPSISQGVDVSLMETSSMFRGSEMQQSTERLEPPENLSNLAGEFSSGSVPLSSETLLTNAQLSLPTHDNIFSNSKEATVSRSNSERKNAHSPELEMFLPKDECGNPINVKHQLLDNRPFNSFSQQSHILYDSVNQNKEISHLYTDIDDPIDSRSGKFIKRNIQDNEFSSFMLESVNSNYVSNMKNIEVQMSPVKTRIAATLGEDSVTHVDQSMEVELEGGDSDPNDPEEPTDGNENNMPAASAISTEPSDNQNEVGAVSADANGLSTQSEGAEISVVVKETEVDGNENQSNTGTGETEREKKNEGTTGLSGITASGSQDDTDIDEGVDVNEGITAEFSEDADASELKSPDEAEEGLEVDVDDLIEESSDAPDADEDKVCKEDTTDGLEVEETAKIIDSTDNVVSKAEDNEPTTEEANNDAIADQEGESLDSEQQKELLSKDEKITEGNEIVAHEQNVESCLDTEDVEETETNAEPREEIHLKPEISEKEKSEEEEVQETDVHEDMNTGNIEEENKETTEVTDNERESPADIDVDVKCDESTQEVEALTESQRDNDQDSINMDNLPESKVDSDEQDVDNIENETDNEICENDELILCDSNEEPKNKMDENILSTNEEDKEKEIQEEGRDVVVCEPKETVTCDDKTETKLGDDAEEVEMNDDSETKPTEIGDENAEEKITEDIDSKNGHSESKVGETDEGAEGEVTEAVDSQSAANEAEEGSESKVVEIKECTEDKDIEDFDGSKDVPEEAEEGSESKAGEREESTEDRDIEAADGSKDATDEAAEGFESKVGEMDESTDDKDIEAADGSKGETDEAEEGSKGIEIEASTEDKEVEAVDGSKDATDENEEGFESKVGEIEECEEDKDIETADGSKDATDEIEDGSESKIGETEECAEDIVNETEERTVGVEDGSKDTIDENEDVSESKLGETEECPKDESNKPEDNINTEAEDEPKDVDEEAEEASKDKINETLECSEEKDQETEDDKIKTVDDPVELKNNEDQVIRCTESEFLAENEGPLENAGDEDEEIRSDEQEAEDIEETKDDINTDKDNFESQPKENKEDTELVDDSTVSREQIDGDVDQTDEPLEAQEESEDKALSEKEDTEKQSDKIQEDEGGIIEVLLNADERKSAEQISDNENETVEKSAIDMEDVTEEIIETEIKASEAIESSTLPGKQGELILEKDTSSDKVSFSDSNKVISPRKGIKVEEDEIETAISSVQFDDEMNEGNEATELMPHLEEIEENQTLFIVKDNDLEPTAELVSSNDLEIVLEQASQDVDEDLEGQEKSLNLLSPSKQAGREEKVVSEGGHTPSSISPKKRKKKRKGARSRSASQKGTASATKKTQDSKASTLKTSQAEKAPSRSSSSTASRNASATDKKIPPIKAPVGNAPPPNVKNVKSKIGSLENVTHKPKGGDKKVEHVKLEWNAKSKVGSLDYATHKPGGGDKKIITQKVDFKNVGSRVGSKDNLKHKPGGGTVKCVELPSGLAASGDQLVRPSKKVTTEKLDFKAKAASKVGSLDNAKHKPGGGNVVIKSEKLHFKENAAPKILSRTGSEKGSSHGGSEIGSPIPPSSPAPPENMPPLNEDENSSIQEDEKPQSATSPCNGEASSPEKPQASSPVISQDISPGKPTTNGENEEHC